MTSRAVLLLALAGWAGASPAAGQVAPPPPAEVSVAKAIEPLGPPARPASRLLDQTGALSAPELAALSREFTTAATGGLSLYFVALKSSEGLPEQDAAGELARLWEDAPLTAVLLQLPGQPMSLGFSGPQLASRSKEEIASLTASALAAGNAHQVLAEQVKAVAGRLTGDLSTRGGANGAQPASDGPGAAASSGVSTYHLMMAGGVGAMVVLTALLLLARRRHRNRPRLFPLTAARDRFSAPHSGGNNAMITFLDENKRG
ncbi:MAG: hypothetical protein V4675_06660 [Verrucomicrobiota bacterium]